MRLYTATGDDGTTGLFRGGRVWKDHPRVIAFGEADGLNAAVGLAVAACDEGTMRAMLARLQCTLFTLGADLATPPETTPPDTTPPETTHQKKTRRISDEDVAWMESQIDAVDGDNEPLTGFILPGGCEVAARLHVARDHARRCERAMVTLSRIEAGGVSEPALRWINRCSDLLFAAARAANRLAGVADVPWRGS
jgi:cob(I)alamin adenosyltransferase